MEIILREPEAESTSKTEVKTLLNDNRFVDDLGASDHDHIRLVEEVEEYIRVCCEYGFEHGEVSSTNNVFEGSEKSQIRTMLGIKWDPKTDLYTPNSEWNISAKSRGTYKEKSLKLMSDTELQNIVVTKTLTSRLLGQTHEPLEKNYSPLLICKAKPPSLPISGRNLLMIFN